MYDVSHSWIWYKLDSYNAYYEFKVVFYQFLVEFENKFRFHNGNELPPPEPFTGSNKNYPSKNPRHQGMYSHLQGFAKDIAHNWL